MPYSIVLVECNEKKDGPGKEEREWKNIRDLRTAKAKLRAIQWSRETYGPLPWSCKILHNGVEVVE